MGSTLKFQSRYRCRFRSLCEAEMIVAVLSVAHPKVAPVHQKQRGKRS